MQMDPRPHTESEEPGFCVHCLIVGENHLLYYLGPLAAAEGSVTHTQKEAKLVDIIWIIKTSLQTLSRNSNSYISYPDITFLLAMKIDDICLTLQTLH